jgi:hypothetical protein
VNTPRALRQVADALAPHDHFEVDLDLLPSAPSDGDPRIRRYEMIARALADDGQPILAPQLSHQHGQTISYSISSAPARALTEALYRVYCTPSPRGRPGLQGKP